MPCYITLLSFLYITINIIILPLASLGGILDSFINLINSRVLYVLSVDGYDGVPRVQAGHERHTAWQNTLNESLKNFALLLNTTVALNKGADKALIKRFGSPKKSY